MLMSKSSSIAERAMEPSMSALKYLRPEKAETPSFALGSMPLAFQLVRARSPPSSELAACWFLPSVAFAVWERGSNHHREIRVHLASRSPESRSTALVQPARQT